MSDRQHALCSRRSQRTGANFLIVPITFGGNLLVLGQDAFDASVTTFERSFHAAGQGATAFNRKIVDIARRNVDTSFDLAKSLAGSKNLSEMVELQVTYWRKQFGLLADQAEEVRALSTKVTADTAAPIKTQMARRG